MGFMVIIIIIIPIAIVVAIKRVKALDFVVDSLWLIKTTRTNHHY